MAKKRIGRNAFAEELLGGAKEGKPESAEVQTSESAKVTKSESVKVRNHTANNSDTERVSKTYRLRPDLVKRVRLYAAEHGLKLSEVVEAALEAFLQE